MKFKEVFLHLIPVLIVIGLFEITAIQVYQHSSLHTSRANFFLWIFSQAIGGVVLGYFSDKYCRKKTLIATQICGASFLFFFLSQGFKEWTVAFLGLSFNPSPVARAALIDNFPKESKVKLIATTFVAQFIPWCFYFKITEIISNHVLISLIAALSINLLITIFLFKDKRDLETHELSSNILNKKSFRRVAFTLGALFPAQLVFFISDSFFESYTTNKVFFSALGIGSLIGAIIAVFYRKTPHLSLVTLCYGIGVLLSAIPLASTVLLAESDINLSYQLMLFSNLGGFYLPFVYDIILSATSSSYRGTACGIVEAIISISAFFGVLIILFFSPKELNILIITLILFLCATIIQKRGEAHE